MLAIGIIFISAVPSFGGVAPILGSAGTTWKSADGDFTTHFWKEKFFGGGHGDVGNVLMAVGQGFSLQNVMLTMAPLTQGVVPNTKYPPFTVTTACK
ncbi:MAG: hypothetical protein H8E10_15820 [Desulfobacterales bacterium]|nr:hypothetical protein [Desulfobacterales bacterium]